MAAAFAAVTRELALREGSPKFLVYRLACAPGRSGTLVLSHTGGAYIHESLTLNFTQKVDEGLVDVVQNRAGLESPPQA